MQVDESLLRANLFSCLTSVDDAILDAFSVLIYNYVLSVGNEQIVLFHYERMQAQRKYVHGIRSDTSNDVD